MKILVMRHGENIRDNSGNDEGLSENGKEQVRVTEKTLKNQGISWIYSNFTPRACLTTNILSNGLHIPVYQSTQLSDVGVVQSWQRSWVTGESMFESAREYLTRIKEVIDLILLRHQDHETILIVGHKETAWALMHVINGVPLEEAIKTEIKHASITEFNI